MYRDGELTRLTDNAVQDFEPKINTNGHVVWTRDMGDGCGLTADIYLYDGHNVVPITTDAVPESVVNQTPRINSSRQIVWTRYDFCVNPWESEILLYDNGVTVTLRGAGGQPGHPDINSSSLVAWFYHEPPGFEESIELWDAGQITVLTQWGTGPHLNGRGDVAFNRWRDDNSTWEEWLFRDGNFYQLPGDPLRNLNGNINTGSEVVWQAGPSSSADILYLRRLETGDLNCDGAFDGADIDVFFLALGDPSEYESAFPNCDRALADMNSDGAVDGADIDAFFQCLGSGCP